MPLDRFNKNTGRAFGTPPLITSTLALMNELIEIMTAEPDLILARKFDDHMVLLKRKQKLTMDYRANIKSLAGQAEMIKQLPEETRRMLKVMAQKLADTADRNARSLRAAVTAVQRLIQNIIAFVKGEVLADPSYKNPNTVYLELGNYSPTCKPVAVRRIV